MQQSDILCIHQYLDGNPDALAPLIEKYKRPLYGFILKMTEGKGDADEIFQETWFRALKNLHRFRQKNFLGWLFRIARNLIIDRARRQKKTVSLQATSSENNESSLENQIPSPGLDPAEKVAGRTLGEKIDQAISQLSETQKEVFILRIQVGLSFKEIAKIQHCSINTSLARMQYALIHMRSMLKEEYNELLEGSS
jgi:RNA polymerase sigma-70 factor (ECF subfamily)